MSTALDRWAARERRAAEEQIESFKVTLAEHPADAFAWADRVAAAAARLAMLAEIEGARAAGQPVAFLIEHARKEVLRMARYPGRSTGPMHNLMGQLALQSWAELVDASRWWVEDETSDDPAAVLVAREVP